MLDVGSERTQERNSINGTHRQEGESVVGNVCPCCIRNYAEDEARFCFSCREDIDALSTGNPASSDLNPIASLYRYRPPLKRLIHRAKIRDDIPALRVLVRTLALDPRTLAAAAWATHIVPAPSSLWGRLHGRYDIAWLAALAISQQVNKPLCEAPRHLYWRFQKKALLTPSHRRLSLKTPPDLALLAPLQPQKPLRHLEGGPQKRFLVVDDVVTTGRTMCDLASALQRHHLSSEIRCITLADARSGGK